MLVKSGNAHSKIHNIGRSSADSCIWLFKNTLSVVKHGEKKCQRKPLRYVGTELTDHEDKNLFGKPLHLTLLQRLHNRMTLCAKELNTIGAGTSGAGL